MIKIKIKSKSLAAAKDALNGNDGRITRPAFNSPKSQYTKGSEGSRVETDNKNEKVDRENNAVVQAPAMTDHVFASNPVIDNRIHEDSPEMVRRKNAKARDCRTGFRVTDNRVYADSD